MGISQGMLLITCQDGLVKEPGDQALGAAKVPVDHQVELWVQCQKEYPLSSSCFSCDTEQC